VPQIKAITIEARTLPTTALVSAAHNIRTTLVRSVTMINGQPQVDDTVNIPPFWVGRVAPSGPALAAVSPRQSPPTLLRHARGLTGPSVALRAGDRLSLLSYGLVELLDNGFEFTVGSRTIANVFTCQPVDFLYPLSGIISDMDGNPISDMPLAIWSPIESHDVNAGEFEDYEGEASIEFAPALMRNVDVMVGTTRYRILAAEPQPDMMYVHLRLRKADEPLATPG